MLQKPLRTIFSSALIACAFFCLFSIESESRRDSHDSRHRTRQFGLRAAGRQGHGVQRGNQLHALNRDRHDRRIPVPFAPGRDVHRGGGVERVSDVRRLPTSC